MSFEIHLALIQVLGICYMKPAGAVIAGNVISAGWGSINIEFRSIGGQYVLDYDTVFRTVAGLAGWMYDRSYWRKLTGIIAVDDLQMGQFWLQEGNELQATNGGGGRTVETS